MAHDPSGSRKQPRPSGSSTAASHPRLDSSPTRETTPAESPIPFSVHPPAVSPRVTIRGIPSHDSPRESDFISATALSRYRTSALRTFVNERCWRLEDFGPIPILIDDVPVADWFDWCECLTSTNYDELARYHCTYIYTLVREFYENVSVTYTTPGEERVTSTVRGIPVDLTIGWLADTYHLPRPIIDSAAPPEDVIFSDVLHPYCLHTHTEILVGGIHLSYLPLVRSITMNLRPGTHTAELDFGDLSLMYHLRHRIPIDVPRIMIRFIVDACIGIYAFSFPATITQTIIAAGVETEHFITGALRTKGPITDTSFRQSYRRIRIVGDLPPPEEIPPEPQA